MTRTLEEIFEKYVPVKERAWYPWEWPDTEWFRRKQRENPSEVSAFMKRVKTLADEDFFFFSNEIMRLPGPESILLDPDIHGEVCWLIQQPEDICILIPRGFFKTTIANVHYTIWKLAHDTTMRFLLASKTRDVSGQFLHDIQTHILTNERLHKIYPDLVPARGRGNKKFKLWSKDKLLVERAITNKRGYSITAMGAGQTLTGMHYDHNTYDDIMTPDNARTVEKREGIIKWFNETQPLLDSPGRRFVIGTRYDGGDLYSYIEEHKMMPIYLRGAVEKGEYIWKEPRIVAKVEQAKRELPPDIFSKQYLNLIYDEKTAIFRYEWIKKWNIEDIVHGYNGTDENPDYFTKEMNEWYRTFDIYMGMDCNRTIKKRSNRTAIIVLGVNVAGEKYILDRVCRTMGTIDIEDAFLNKFIEWDKFNLCRAGIETIGGDNRILDHIRVKMMERNLPVHKLKAFFTPRDTPKENRIMDMQPEFYHHRVWIREDMTDLEQELTQFQPVKNANKHDDLIDVLSYILTQLVRPKLSTTVSKEEKGWRTHRRRTVSSGNWMTSG